MHTNIYSKAILAACLALAAPSLLAQEAYKWVDEQGNVHYGDKPPESVSNPVPVEIEPGPSQEQIEEAEEIQQKRIESAETLEAERQARETREAEEAKRLADEKKASEPKQEQQTDDDQVVGVEDDDVIVGPCNDSQGRNTPCIKRAPVNKLPRPEQPIARPPIARPSR